MIKIQPNSHHGIDTITCDFCGAGIVLNCTQDQVDAFVTEHTNCDNLENTDLAFLDTDLEYIP